MADDNPMTYEPKIVAHPGETVVDYLEFNGWSQRDLARRTGLTPKTISEICNGKTPITPPTSLALENVFRRPAHFWLSLQRRYDEAEARRLLTTVGESWRSWAAKFPIGSMKKYGWLNPGHRDSEVDSLLQFFGVSSPDSWKSVWKASNVAYRQTRKFRISNEAVSAWTRRTEIEALELKVADFNEERFRALLATLRTHTRETPHSFVPAVQKLCGSAGVAVVWVPALPQTGISGCARWLTDRRALIALTLRYNTDDQMWLTFFHEAAHILLHRRRYQFILDNADRTVADNVVDPSMRREEEEANLFADETLVPSDQLTEFIRRNDLSSEAIHEFAEAVNVGPGIVVGRLQREGVLAYYQGNKLKQTLKWELSEE